MRRVVVFGLLAGLLVSAPVGASETECSSTDHGTDVATVRLGHSTTDCTVDSDDGYAVYRAQYHQERSYVRESATGSELAVEEHSLEDRETSADGDLRCDRRANVLSARVADIDAYAYDAGHGCQGTTLHGDAEERGGTRGVNVFRQGSHVDGLGVSWEDSRQGPYHKHVFFGAAGMTVFVWWGEHDGWCYVQGTLQPALVCEAFFRVAPVIFTPLP